MAVLNNSEDAKNLRKLVPLESYPIAAFEELCANINVEQVRDQAVVKRGDINPDLIYLLTGTVTLQAEGLVIETIEAGSDSAKFALAHQIPRKIDVMANGLVRVVRLSADVVNNPPPIEFKEDNNYTIVEESGVDGDDWLTVLLKMPLFQDFAPANLQKLMISIKTDKYCEGDVIIESGSDVDHFYVITKGQCSAVRSGSTGGIERRLSAGETLGEESLIMGTLSKERVTAHSELTLIKLERNQFFNLIIRPLLPATSFEDLPKLVNKGGMLIDVRSKQTAEKKPLDTGVNIPYINLANKIRDLDKARPIITYADDKTSLAAAFMLLKQGFKLHTLSDGTNSPEPETEIKPEPVEKKLEAVETAEQTPTMDQAIQEHFAEEIEAIKNEKNLQAQIKRLKPEAEVKFLRAENERLNEYVRELEDTVTQLKIEKQKLAMRTELLALQLKKLKMFLMKYRDNKQAR